MSTLARVTFDTADPHRVARFWARHFTYEKFSSGSAHCARHAGGSHGSPK